jgi:sporulation protein YlmC with PRC-barrel domain
MQSRSQKLLGIPVRTRSGESLGRLGDVSIDCDTGRIDVLLVKTRGFIPGLMDQELRISWSQVISMDTKEAVVADGTVPVATRRFAIGGAAPRTTT